MQWSFGCAALGYGDVLSFVLLCSVKCHVEVLCWIIWWQVGLLGNGFVLICSIRLFCRFVLLFWVACLAVVLGCSGALS